MSIQVQQAESALADSGRPRRVLAVNIDADMLGLLREWLDGREVVAENEPSSRNFDCVVVDVPFPRRGGLHVLEQVRAEHPRAAILVMSSSFFHDVPSDGGVARALRVAGVLPKPFTRDALLTALERGLGATV